MRRSRRLAWKKCTSRYGAPYEEPKYAAGRVVAIMLMGVWQSKAYIGAWRYDGLCCRQAAERVTRAYRSNHRKQEAWSRVLSEWEERQIWH